LGSQNIYDVVDTRHAEKRYYPWEKIGFGKMYGSGFFLEPGEKHSLQFITYVSSAYDMIRFEFNTVFWANHNNCSPNKPGSGCSKKVKMLWKFNGYEAIQQMQVDLKGDGKNWLDFNPADKKHYEAFESQKFAFNTKIVEKSLWNNNKK
jgi:hypothetical protein